MNKAKPLRRTSVAFAAGGACSGSVYVSCDSLAQETIGQGMIKGILVINNHGMPRLMKFYQSVTGEEEQQSVLRQIFQQVSQRPDTFCNYLAGRVPEWGDETKIIYRHYATLYFVFAVDKQESDLGILDLIQVFVESLDKSFENVCELDLIFHSDKVNYILDEIIMAGMVLETNIRHILTSVNEQSKLHNQSMKLTTGAAAGLAAGAAANSFGAAVNAFGLASK